MKQGPRWEALVTHTLDMIGLKAKRIDKSGETGVSDVQVGDPDSQSPVFLAWKRYMKGGPRRKTIPVLVMSWQDGLRLIQDAGWTDFYIECKASQSESVTKILEDATAKVRKS